MKPHFNIEVMKSNSLHVPYRTLHKLREETHTCSVQNVDCSGAFARFPPVNYAMQATYNLQTLRVPMNNTYPSTRSRISLTTLHPQRWLLRHWPLLLYAHARRTRENAFEINETCIIIFYSHVSFAPT